MANQRKINITGIIAACLLFFTFIAMAMPLTQYYDSYYGKYYSYDSFYGLLATSFEYMLEDFWALLHVFIFMVILGAQVFAVLSIFKKKMAIPCIITSGVAVNSLIFYAIIESVAVDEIGSGGYLMGLLFIGALVLSIITLIQKTSDEVYYPIAPTVCRQCYREVPAGNSFCGYCATPVARFVQRFCLGCGNPVQPGQTYCQNCNSYARAVNVPAPAWICSNCQTANAREFNYCQRCGWHKG